MKKVLCLVGLVVLCSALAFAGGRQQEAASTKTVVTWGMWPSDTQPEQVALYENHVKRFNEKYPDIIIEPSPSPYSADNYIPRAEAGLLPTVYEAWLTETRKIIDGGFARDITDEMKAMGWDTKMEDSFKTQLMRNGRLYAFPENIYAMCLFLNVPLFREAGLVDSNGLPIYPKTWDELALTAQTIKQKTGVPGMAFFGTTNQGGWMFTNLAWSFGAELEVQRNGRWIAQLNSPEAVQAMNYIKDLKWRYDALTADPSTENFYTAVQKLGTGTVAMMTGHTSAFASPTYQNGLPVGDLGTAPMPAGPKGQYALAGGGSYYFAKNATSEQVIAALRFMEYLGWAPVVTEESVAGIRNTAESNKQLGIPVVPGISVWNDAAYNKAMEDAMAPFYNVDMRLYNDMYAAARRPGYFYPEEPMLTQDLYAELDKVIQAVVTDRNANVQALLDVAQRNFQGLLDSQVNN
jgi:ABC-type glycerol-3-phosphate transport system substrate-binding protein